MNHDALDDCVTWSGPVATFPLDWSAFHRHLEAARERSELPHSPPPPSWVPRRLHWLAGPVVRALFRVVRFLLQPQSAHNVHTLHVLRELEHQLRQLEVVQQVRFRRLDAELSAALERLDELQRRERRAA
jgi:hypothetical protein